MKRQDIEIYRNACRTARPLLAAQLQSEIENNATPETTKREGAIKANGKYYYHEDTIDEPESKRAIRLYRRAIKMIDAALTTGERGDG